MKTLSERTRRLILDVAVNSTKSTGGDAIELAVSIQAFIEAWLSKKHRA